jgi:hypothetical protein
MRKLLPALLFLVVTIGPAWAGARDDLLFPPELFRSGEAKVGDWLEYEAKWPDATKELVKVAIVGTKAESDARKLPLLEVSYAPPEGPPELRELYQASVWPADYRKGETPLPARYVISTVSGTAAKFSPEKVRRAFQFLMGPARFDRHHWLQDYTAWMAQAAAKGDGKEEVTVPAGTFECEILKAGDSQGTQAYISSKVPLWGVVKLTAYLPGVSAPAEFVLKGFGTDAQTGIDSAIIGIDELLQGDEPPPPTEPEQGGEGQG